MATRLLRHSTKPLGIKQAKETFLEAFSDGHSVNHAAKGAGLTRGTPYKWADDDPTFAEAWKQAWEARGDWYEDRLRDQADKGIPVSTIVGLKMHKRFIEERGVPLVGGDLHLHITQVTNQLTLIMAELDAMFPGLLDAYQERVKALGEGQK